MTRLGAEQEPRCESGWTGDRCDLPIFHDGPHSNEQPVVRGYAPVDCPPGRHPLGCPHTAAERLSPMARRVGVNKRAGRRLVWEF